MTDESTAGGPEQTARTRILRAAEELFARDGFDRTPVSRIAKLAGVPHGLVFYYFQTKIGLLLSLIHDYSSRLVVVLDDLPERGPDGPGSPYELVDHVLNAMRELLRSRTAIRRIMFQEMSAHPEVRAKAQAFHQESTEAMSGRFERGMAALGLPVEREAAVAAARMVIATMVMAAMLYEQDDPRMTVRELAAAVSGSLQYAAAR